MATYKTKDADKTVNEIINLKDAHFLSVEVEWDTDGEKVELPKKILIACDEEMYHNLIDDEGGVADYLSDRYGWCVDNLSVDEMTKFNPNLRAEIEAADEVTILES